VFTPLLSYAARRNRQWYAIAKEQKINKKNKKNQRRKVKILAASRTQQHTHRH